MRITLIRHGLTEGNIKRLYYGRSELALLEESAKELKRLAAAGFYPKAERYYTSGMLRAEQSFHAIYGETEHGILPALREMDFGDFEMRSYEELKDDPAYIEWITGDNEANIAPNGESGEMVTERALKAIEEIAREGYDAAIVTHGGVIGGVIARLFPHEYNRFTATPEPGGSAAIEFESGRATSVRIKEPKMIIETERLILRPFEPSDAGSIFIYASDKRVGPRAGWPPHKSIEESQRIVDAFCLKPELYAIVPKELGQAAGCIQIKRGADTDMTEREDEGEIGYWIGFPFWGRGLMTEAVRAVCLHAFIDLDFNALWCGYYEGNTASARVQEKCGFVYQHRTEGLFLPLLNETRDGHLTLLTREDWEKANGAGKKEGSVFERIYAEVRRIPKGRVATYGQIAALAGNPRWSRVVGYALHVNPEPGVIPCHRVVDRNGRLSPAFAFGGVNMQEKLLAEEGVEVSNGRVELDKYRM